MGFALDPSNSVIIQYITFFSDFFPYAHNFEKSWGHIASGLSVHLFVHWFVRHAFLCIA